jgi:hypothetical protein
VNVSIHENGRSALIIQQEEKHMQFSYSAGNKNTKEQQKVFWQS